MKRPGAETVAVILAIGIAIALLGLTGTVVYSLVVGRVTSEPARLVAITQVLTGWGGGMLGVLGAYVGYSFRGRHDDDHHQD